MAGLADKIQIDEAISGQHTEDFKLYTSDKNVSYVVDQQNGNYSNQVSWDLSSLVNQNSWMSLQEGYVLMPFSTVLTRSAAQASSVSVNVKAITLKDSFINFVDSLQLFVNGTQLIDQTTFSNLAVQVMDKLLMSQDDLILKGSANNIAPDTMSSVKGNTSATTVYGDGFSNNLLQTATAFDPRLVNQGATKRSLQFLDTATNATSLMGTINTSTLDAQILAPYYVNTTTTTVGTWNYCVYLPLKRLGDLFTKYPLIKGSQIRLVLNFNSCTSNLTNPASTDNDKMSLASHVGLAGNTCPHMITATSTSGTTNASASTTTITTRISTTAYPNLPNCRIFIPSYVVNPTYEARMLSNRKQTIEYLDWYQQPIINVANNATFSQTLTTALPNVQFLLMMPFANSSTNGSIFAASTASGVSQFQLPFDAAPAQTLPLACNAFQNFNVQVSGQNVFNQNLNYVYDSWATEVQKIGLNAGLSRELSSGLHDLTSWTYSPYIIADLSRRSEAAQNTYQSVVVQGQNKSGLAVDYNCFIAFKKTISVDILTGQVERIF